MHALFSPGILLGLFCFFKLYMMIISVNPSDVGLYLEIEVKTVMYVIFRRLRQNKPYDTCVTGAYYQGIRVGSDREELRFQS
jgi:hypothetical protein